MSSSSSSLKQKDEKKRKTCHIKFRINSEEQKVSAIVVVVVSFLSNYRIVCSRGVCAVVVAHKCQYVTFLRRRQQQQGKLSRATHLLS